MALSSSCLLAAGCSFDSPPPTPVEGNIPRTAVIFCNIEKDRQCASDVDEVMGIDLADQYSGGFWAGRASAFGIDRSPAALAACGGKPQKVLYHGPFPEGLAIGVNAKELFGVDGGLGSWPGQFLGKYSSINKVCQAWCAQQPFRDGSGNPYSCTDIAWQATGASNPVLNAADTAGTPLTTTMDLRKIKPQPIVWTSAINVNVNGNNLSKAGTAYDWDAGAASLTTLASGDGYFEFTTTETDKDRMIGLAIGDTDVDPGPSDIAFAVFLRKDGRLLVQEFGVTRFSLPVFSSGRRIRVGIVGGVVQYFQDEQLFYTSATPINPVNSYPLRVSASIKNAGGTFSNVRTTF